MRHARILLHRKCLIPPLISLFHWSYTKKSLLSTLAQTQSMWSIRSVSLLCNDTEQCISPTISLPVIRSKTLSSCKNTMRSLINLNNWTVTSNIKHYYNIKFVAFERLHCRIEAYYRKHVVRIGKNYICIYLPFKNM